MPIGFVHAAMSAERLVAWWLEMERSQKRDSCERPQDASAAVKPTPTLNKSAAGGTRILRIKRLQAVIRGIDA